MWIHLTQPDIGKNSNGAIIEVLCSDTFRQKESVMVLIEGVKGGMIKSKQ